MLKHKTLADRDTLHYTFYLSPDASPRIANQVASLKCRENEKLFGAAAVNIRRQVAPKIAKNRYQK